MVKQTPRRGRWLYIVSMILLHMIKVLVLVGCLRFTKILLGWKTSKYDYETDQLPNPRPTLPKKKKVKAVLCAGLLFLGCKHIFFCFQVSFRPVQRGNRAGSSRNKFDYSRRGAQTSFPLLGCRSCEKFGVAHFSFFLLEKKN